LLVEKKGRKEGKKERRKEGRMDKLDVVVQVCNPSTRRQSGGS
jgi:hypothetical protein